MKRTKFVCILMLLSGVVTAAPNDLLNTVNIQAVDQVRTSGGVVILKHEQLITEPTIPTIPKVQKSAPVNKIYDGAVVSSPIPPSAVDQPRVDLQNIVE